MSSYLDWKLLPQMLLACSIGMAFAFFFVIGVMLWYRRLTSQIPMDRYGPSINLGTPISGVKRVGGPAEIDWSQLVPNDDAETKT